MKPQFGRESVFTPSEINHEDSDSLDTKFDADRAIKRAIYTRIGAMALTVALMASNGAARDRQSVESANTVAVEENDESIFTQTVANESGIRTPQESPLGDSSVTSQNILPQAGESAIMNISPNTALISSGNIPSAGVDAILSTTENPKVDSSVSADQTSTISENEPESWDGPILSAENGRVKGPSGCEETYYNLPMHNVVDNMHDLGYEGKYWVRSDGVKMFGEYVMVAADLNLYPRGSIVETSRGPGIVCDTGEFAKTNHKLFDIATDW